MTTLGDVVYFRRRVSGLQQRESIVQAYVAVVITRDAGGPLLLGGTRRHESSPFAMWRDATAWSDTIVAGNLEANRPAIHGGIHIVHVAAKDVIPDARSE